MRRLLVIGQLVDVRDRVIAYRLFDDISKKSEFVSLKELRALLDSGVKVLGIKKSATRMEKRRAFVPPTVDSSGEPIDDVPRYVLLECIGFLEAASYRVVSGGGVEKVVSAKEFRELLSEGRICGATLLHTGRVQFRAGFEYRAPSKIGRVSI